MGSTKYYTSPLTNTEVKSKGSRKNSDSTLECIQTLSTEVGMHSDRESVFP